MHYNKTTEMVGDRNTRKAKTTIVSLVHTECLMVIIQINAATDLWHNNYIRLLTVTVHIEPPTRRNSKYIYRPTAETERWRIGPMCRPASCIKSFVGWGSAPDPAGELTALPQTLSWILGNLLLRGGEGTRGEGKGKGRGGERREGERRKEGREGRGRKG